MTISIKIISILIVSILLITPLSTGFCYDYYEDYHHENPSSDSSDSSSQIPTSGGSSPESSHDSAITSKIENASGSLMDVVKLTRHEEGSLSENIHSLTALVNTIKTPSGARAVLDAMPQTLNELLNLKAEMTTVSDKILLEQDIVDLMVATERLVELISHTDQGTELLTNLFEPLGAHYQDMNTKDQRTKQLMNTTITMSNSVIKKAGTLQLNWNGIEITDGTVYLSPDPADIKATVINAAKAEALFENLLNTHIDTGLEEAVISTFTLKVPENLETAAKTGIHVDSETLKTLNENKIEKMDIDLGPAKFTLSDKFVSAHEETTFEFHSIKNKPLNDHDEGLPEGMLPIGAPVLDLMAKQNDMNNHEFDHPVELTLELDFFEYDPIDHNSLVIGRLNEETHQWEPVGGKYNPNTNSMTIYRIHLSKYTILKSEKSYSNIEDSWAKNEIAALTHKGIIDNVPNFAATENVTREEFAGWIAKAYGLDKASLQTDLSDLDPSSPYYNSIATAYDQGIISGKSNGNFDPNAPVTREEMAVMIASAMQKYEYSVNTDTFSLADYEQDLPEWAIHSVEHVVENGLVDESYFGSADSVTKEEAAAILYQVYR